jgi:hypothetical protein
MLAPNSPEELAKRKIVVVLVTLIVLAVILYPVWQTVR